MWTCLQDKIVKKGYGMSAGTNLQGSMTIQREYTMWCARCTDYDDFQEDNAKEAEKEARRLRWRKRPEGWVCPSCVTSEELLKRAERSKAKR